MHEPPPDLSLPVHHTTWPDHIVHAAGELTAVAASRHAGVVAAGFKPLQKHRSSSSSGLLAIWQPLPRPLIHAAPPKANTAGSSRSSTAGTGKDNDWQLALVAELHVDSSPLAICWLDHLQAAAPAIAVAQGPASLTVYAQLPR